MHRANKVYEEDLHSYQHTISQLNADSWYHCILDARELPAERIDAALKHLIVYSPKAVGARRNSGANDNDRRRYRSV